MKQVGRALAETSDRTEDFDITIDDGWKTARGSKKVVRISDN